MPIASVKPSDTLALGLVSRFIDQLTWAVFIVDPDRAIKFANQQAQRLLSEGELVVSTMGRLATVLPGQAATLNTATADFLNGKTRSCAGVSLEGRNGRRAAVYFLALGIEGCCAILVASSAEQSTVLPEVIGAMFDLTPAEARVSSMIARGERPGDIAHRLDLSVNTVRCHLARAFAKTGTPDQAGLTGLLWQISPPVQLHA